MNSQHFGIKFMSLKWIIMKFKLYLETYLILVYISTSLYLKLTVKINRKSKYKVAILIGMFQLFLKINLILKILIL